MSLRIEPELSVLVQNLGKLAPETRRNLRVGLQGAGKGVLTDAKSNAAWSSRIPGALTLKVSTAANTTGITLRANADRAPHARPYEGIEGNGKFRHPLYGDRTHWYSQATRPFMAPAAQAGYVSVRAAAEEAVKAAARTAGFH